MGASKSSVINYAYDDELNGLVLCGKLVPETVLEIILSFVNIPDILKLRQVCRLWKDIVARRMFWKEVFERNGNQWKAIPEHIKENANVWMASYWLLNQKNMVKNHSGHERLKYWVRTEDLAQPIITESPPVGIDSLPVDPIYREKKDSAFVTSYRWGSMEQHINLKKVGLTPDLLNLLVPFNFHLKVMVGARFDCGGDFTVGLYLLSEDEDILASNDVSGEVYSASGWTEVVCTLKVVNVTSARYLFVLIKGKDNQFWAGQYGAKFARISVSLDCIERR